MKRKREITTRHYFEEKIMPVHVNAKLATIDDIRDAIAGAAIRAHPLPQGFAEIPQQMNQMQRTQQQIEQQLQQMHQQLQQMQQHMLRMENASALANNRSRAEDDHPLMPLRVGDDAVPPQFPVVLSSLRSLSGPSCNACLQYYELPVNGTVQQKRRRLAGHIGARIV